CEDNDTPRHHTRKNRRQRQLCIRDSNNGDAIGIYAYSIKSDISSEQIAEKFSVILDWDDVRIRLKNKNMPFPNISKWHVSGSLGV
ncbi:hypothetical protein, partial [Aeromonas rivipollensis]|uniref:hypothetical protein n=1 Tax=Aeromonas rivipollensis TaxID=948519 RepID=UPI003D043B90